MLRIYLARHGETDWNREHRVQGSSDTELNATGRAQARRLAERLAGIDLDRIYCSRRKRARQTAAALEGHAPITLLAELNEQSLGCFEGKLVDGSDGEVIREFMRRVQNPDDTLDNGESINQHLARVATAVARILNEHPHGTILIVGHGGTNSLIVRTLLGLSGDQALAIHQANDELYRVDLEAGAPIAIMTSRADGAWHDAELPLGGDP